MRQTVALVASFALAGWLGASSIAWAASEPTADARATADSPRHEAIAAERKRFFVAIVGAAALVFGVAGLWLVRRSRKKAEPAAEVAPPSAPPSAAPESAPARASGSVVMVCPTCRDEYGRDARFCKLDGNRLVAVREGSDARGPTGGVCPACGQGFDPGIQLCPVHHEELVPAPVFQAAQRVSSSYPKICPTCGIQYPNGSGFCGADGSALVTIN